EEVGEKNPWLAIKILNSNISQHAFSWGALQRECKKTQQLSHPHIVSVFDFDRDGDTLFMSMEFLDGVSLDEIINKSSFLGWPIEKVEKLVEHVGSALSYAHSKGIIHSDLKPSNIFMTREGDFKVYDFGIARAVHDVSSGDSTQCEEPLVALTPAYASVGMLLEEKAKPTDDLYALGCVVYMAATSVHPYGRETALVARDKKLLLVKPKGLPKHKSSALCDVLNVVNPKINDVAQFKEAFNNQSNNQSKRTLLGVVFGGGVVVMLLVLIGVYFSGYSEREVLGKLRSDDVDVITLGVGDIEKMDAEKRFRFLDRYRGDLIDFYQIKTQALMAKGSYLAATTTLARAREFYSDSMSLSSLANELNVAQLRHYQQLKDKGELLLNNDMESERGDELQSQLPALVEALKHVQGGLELLSQWKLDQWLAQNINEALYLGRTKDAKQLLALADNFYPKDERFSKIHTSITLMDPLAHSLVQEGQQGTGNRGFSAGMSSEDLKHISHVYQRIAQGELIQNPEQIKQFIDQLDKDDSEWGKVLSLSIRDFMSKGYLSFKNDSSKDGRKAAKRYQQLANQLYPGAAEFRVKKRKFDPCNKGWAGKGRSARYQCRDSLSRNLKAPPLVIIPGTKSIRRFAIMSTELSVAHYNNYCRLYRRCNAIGGDTSLPVMNISLQEARRYSRWLSQVAGFTYRLPTVKEWQHAVLANKGQQLNDHNCLLTQGAKVIRGNNVRPISKGTANAWGVKNGLGNVQEWALSGGKALTIGGSAVTPLTHCNINYALASNDDNALTGLRLVREL
ncbi:MAG: protein kinase, partial [Pseudomonadales bacterium]|nr:protein kinase [Pseudomonadales bacterium]